MSQALARTMALTRPEEVSGLESLLRWFFRQRSGGRLLTSGWKCPYSGSGANSGRQGDRLGSTWLSELRWAQAASAAFHNSEIVAFRPSSLPVLYCPFLIFSANSIPEIVTAALSNCLNPSMGRIRCFTLR